MTDKTLIKRCIELAKKAEGKTYPNPLVGSIIVHNGKIIGEGYHEKSGENHAEINAINSVENIHLLKDSTIYVTLEPCSHFGKTPPCANKIVEQSKVPIKYFIFFLFLFFCNINFKMCIFCCHIIIIYIQEKCISF